MGSRLVKQSFPTRSSSSFRLFMAAQKNQGFSLPPFFQPPQQNSGGPSLPSFFQPPQQSSGGPSFPSFFQPPEQSSGGFSLPSFFQAPKQTPEISPTVASSNARELSARWRELAGSNDWAGLLDPMDPVLRSELIRYGEFAQGCYDAFDFDRYSKYCGGCKYPRESFFESLRMADVGYRVTRYLYATSNIQLPNFSLQPIMKDPTLDPTNWIGYVAVSDDATSARLGRRDIIVAWRGTISKLEWISDITDIQQPLADEGIPCPDKSVKALLGFLNLYTDKDPSVPVAKYSVREQALAEVKRLVGLYGEKQGEELSISVAGHSLGSALATLNAFDIAEVGLHKVGKDKVIPITVYSFSGPRVGNDAFKKRFEETLKIKCIRVLNIADVVPAVPGVAVNEQTPEAWQRSAGAVVPWSYYHVGVKLELDHTKSPFLKNTIDVAGFHNLEALMHLVDGYHGKGQKFSSASGRDPAPVNKKSDFLKEELMVPPYWKQESDRGLVRIAAGKWAQPDRARFDEHPEDMDRVLQQIGVLASSRA